MVELPDKDVKAYDDEQIIKLLQLNTISKEEYNRLLLQYDVTQE